MNLDAEVNEMESISLRLSWLTRRRLEQELAAFGLTPPQYMALHCIERHPQGCSMSELADASHQMAATMTGIIDRLVEAGLVQRQRHPHDRRTLQVRLTAAGQALLAQIIQHKRETLRQMLAQLPDDERRQMIDVSRRYLALLEQNVPAPA